MDTEHISGQDNCKVRHRHGKTQIRAYGATGSYYRRLQNRICSYRTLHPSHTPRTGPSKSTRHFANNIRTNFARVYTQFYLVYTHALHYHSLPLTLLTYSFIDNPHRYHLL